MNDTLQAKRNCSVCKRGIDGDVMLNNPISNSDVIRMCTRVIELITAVKYGAKMLYLMTSRIIPNVLCKATLFNAESLINKTQLAEYIFEYVIHVYIESIFGFPKKKYGPCNSNKKCFSVV